MALAEIGTYRHVILLAAADTDDNIDAAIRQLIQRRDLLRCPHRIGNTYSEGTIRTRSVTAAAADSRMRISNVYQVMRSPQEMLENGP